MDLMNAMQRCGILKDKCFSQYKSSPHSGQRSLHTALTVTVFCLHQSLMNQVMRPRQATTLARRVTLLQVTAGWRHLLFTNSRLGAARLVSSTRRIIL